MWTHTLHSDRHYVRAHILHSDTYITCGHRYYFQAQTLRAATYITFGHRHYIRAQTLHSDTYMWTETLRADTATTTKTYCYMAKLRAVLWYSANKPKFIPRQSGPHNSRSFCTGSESQCQDMCKKKATGSTHECGFRFSAPARSCRVLTASRRVLRPPQCSAQWTYGILSLWVKGAGEWSSPLTFTQYPSREHMKPYVQSPMSSWCRS